MKEWKMKIENEFFYLPGTGFKEAKKEKEISKRIKVILNKESFWIGFFLYFLSIIFVLFKMNFLSIIFFLFGAILHTYLCAHFFIKNIQTKRYLCSFISYFILMILVSLFFSFVYAYGSLYNLGCLTFENCGQGCNGNINGNWNWETIYFSGVTLATLGYGDLCPEGDFFRIISLIEAVTGLGINVVLIALAISKIKE